MGARSTGGADLHREQRRVADMWIASTVTSNVVGRKIQPVQNRSLVAARVGSFDANQGTLAVWIRTAPPRRRSASRSRSPARRAERRDEHARLRGLRPRADRHVPGQGERAPLRRSLRRDVDQRRQGRDGPAVQTQVLRTRGRRRSRRTASPRSARSSEHQRAAMIASNAALPSPGVRIFSPRQAARRRSRPAGCSRSRTATPCTAGHAAAGRTAHPVHPARRTTSAASARQARRGSERRGHRAEPALNFQVQRGSGGSSRRTPRGTW